MNKGMGGHQAANSKSVVWLTPPEILHPLGEFDLDPCAATRRPFPTAKTHYTKQDNGLAMPWFGRVWMNPPYGVGMDAWLKRMADHYNGIALLFARTDTKDFHKYIFPVASSMLFLEGRINFLTAGGTRANGNSGAPSVLVSYNEYNAEILEQSGLRGQHIPLNSIPVIIITSAPTWKNILKIAMVRLNNQANLSEVYKIVEKSFPGKVLNNKHYQAKIRQTLQQYFKRVDRGEYAAPELFNN